MTDTDDHSALGRSVQFGDGHSCYFSGSRKLSGLFEGILSGASIQYKQHFVWSIGNLLLHHTLYLGEFVHESLLVVQSAGSIYQHHIGIVGQGACQSVKCHAGRIAAHVLLDYRHTHTFAPDAQLLHGSSAEGIGSSQIHLQSCFLELIGQFAYCGGLAHSVHSHHHHHVGLLA